MLQARDLKEDLKRYGLCGQAYLLALIILSLPVIWASCQDIVSRRQGLAGVVALALLAGVISSRHALKLTGTNVGSSASDMLTFLSILAFGPHGGVILASVDMGLTSKRLGLRPTLYAFNISNGTLSFYLAGTAYVASSNYINAHPLSSGLGQDLLVFAAPLIVLALAHYILNSFVVASMARIAFRRGVRATLLNKLPWEPMAYVAIAVAAGVVNYVAVNRGLIIAAVTLVLVLPVPILIYYTFKTYRDKLEDQDRHYTELTAINDSILEMLAMAIDAKDQTTHDHIQRVRLFARRMGEIVGLSKHEIEALKAGALLHDIGKIGVPAYILNKPGKLTEHEFEQMKMHTIIGADMLSNVKFQYPVVPIVRHHHERWDGKGYPDGLKGNDIPMTARILTLVDNYDALRSDRPYHKALGQQETLDYIRDNAGKFFDPKLVETFLSIVDDLESQASQINLEEIRKPVIPESSALHEAEPAAGFATGPIKLDRAAAALHSIAETNQRVTALYELARNLAGAFSLEDTTAVLANRMAKLIPFTTLAISLYDGTKCEFQIVHAVGREAERFLFRRLPVSSGITGWVIQNRRPMYNTNPVLDLSFLGPQAEEYRALMVFPLVKNNQALGAIGLYATEMESYSSEYIQIMESISQPVSDSIYNALTFEQAQRAALTDTVTGLANMRAFAAYFEREQARNLRSGAPLSVLLATVENLPGAARSSTRSEEELVSMLGKLLKDRLRETDLIARHGSSSFAVLLPESGSNEALEVMARVHEVLAAASRGAGLSVSLGAATSPNDGATVEQLTRSARQRSLPVRESFADHGFISR